MGCSCFEGGPVQDQAYFEDQVYWQARDYDIVHGVARVESVCEHDLVMDCPSGRIADPVTVAIDADWLPQTARLDRSLPIFSDSNQEPNMGFGAYIALGRFVGLQAQPEANVVCDGEPAVEGRRNNAGPFLWDSHLARRGIDHDGLRAAIERGIADSSGEVSAAGGTHLIQCAGPSE